MSSISESPPDFTASQLYYFGLLDDIDSDASESAIRPSSPLPPSSLPPMIRDTFTIPVTAHADRPPIDPKATEDVKENPSRREQWLAGRKLMASFSAQVAAAEYSYRLEDVVNKRLAPDKRKASEIMGRSSMNAKRQKIGRYKHNQESDDTPRNHPISSGASQPSYSQLSGEGTSSDEDGHDVKNGSGIHVCAGKLNTVASTPSPPNNTQEVVDEDLPSTRGSSFSSTGFLEDGKEKEVGLRASVIQCKRSPTTPSDSTNSTQISIRSGDMAPPASRRKAEIKANQVIYESIQAFITAAEPTTNSLSSYMATYEEFTPNEAIERVIHRDVEFMLSHRRSITSIQWAVHHYDSYSQTVILNVIDSNGNALERYKYNAQLPFGLPRESTTGLTGRKLTMEFTVRLKTGYFREREPSRVDTIEVAPSNGDVYLKQTIIVPSRGHANWQVCCTFNVSRPRLNDEAYYEQISAHRAFGRKGVNDKQAKPNTDENKVRKDSMDVNMTIFIGQRHILDKYFRS